MFVFVKGRLRGSIIDMASSTELKVRVEEHITCSVCLEIYKDPHELKCRHTFCLECINRLQKKNIIKCPECRSPTKVKEIQKDFKTESLVDSYKQEKQTVSKLSPSKCDVIKCEMCQNPEQAVAYKCVECDQFMCGVCEKIHQGMKICRGHEVQDIQSITKIHHDNFLDKQIELEQLQKNLSNKCEDITRAIKDIETSQTDQLAELKKMKEGMIQKVEAHYKDMEGKLKSTNDELLQSLSESQEMCEQMILEVQSTIDFLAEMSQIDDIAALSDAVQSVEVDFKKQLDETKYKLSKLELEYDVVLRGEEFNPERYMDVLVERATKVAVKEPQVSYSALINKTFKKLQSDPSAAEARRMHLIDGNIWCAMCNGIVNIYSKDCTLLETITLHNTPHCAGVTKAHTGDIIVACYGSGLHDFDSAGKYLGCIAKGSFSDVCCYEEVLYVLDYKNCKVLVFCHSKGKWFCANTVNLQYDNGSNWDKVCMTSTGIYVSSYNNSCIFVHTQEGEFLYQTGKKGSGQAGLFELPVLCDVDDEGNILVCDRHNHRIQVYNQGNGHWSVIWVPGGLTLPFNAVVDPASKFMWVVTLESSEGLIKYSVNK